MYPGEKSHNQSEQRKMGYSSILFVVAVLSFLAWFLLYRFHHGGNMWLPKEHSEKHAEQKASLRENTAEIDTISLESTYADNNNHKNSSLDNKTEDLDEKYTTFLKNAQQLTNSIGDNKGQLSDKK